MKDYYCPNCGAEGSADGDAVQSLKDTGCPKCHRPLAEVGEAVPMDRWKRLQVGFQRTDGSYS